MGKYFIGLLHLFNGTAGTLLAVIFLKRLISKVGMVFGAEQKIDFEMRTFVPALICVGLLVGYWSFSQFRGKSSFGIFIVPLTILVVKILTFRSPSIFESGVKTGWSYFFGVVSCSSYNLHELAKSANQCVNRFCYVGMVYSAASYSVGAFLSHIVTGSMLRKNVT